MRRRDVIIGAVVALAGAGVFYGYRRTMSGMHSLGAVKDMSAMSGPRDMGAMPGTSARITRLPEGQPLRELPRLTNKSTASGRFEATITAAPTKVEFVPGKWTEVLAYNGSTPGPVIDVVNGDAIKIGFANNIPSQDSTIHWHGLPVPPDQDGNPMNPVKSGTTRDYEFTLPTDCAGSFWYHPHPHGATAEQVYSGLAAQFIVRPKNDLLPSELPETTLFISSLSLLESGAIAPNTMLDWTNGREGDHVLVNGQKAPVLTVNPGSSRRFRLYNATNGRYLRLSFQGHGMTLIGTDGGLIGAPVAGINEILLSPAERVEVVVDFQDSAGRIVLQSLPYERGWMGPGKPASASLPILSIEIAGASQRPIPLPSRLREIIPLGTSVATKKLVFGEKMSMGGGDMSMEFLIDGKTFDMARVDLTSRVNDVELWEIVNQTDMDHPLHLHGTQFQVVEREKSGRKAVESLLAWKDTVNVVQGETVRFKMKQMTAGLRMYHCHVLEHEQRGMMGVLNVI